MKFGHICWIGASVLMFSTFVVSVIPAWVFFPDQEASTENYNSLKDLYDKPETEFSTRISGTCSALGPMATLAMKDGVLTVEEVHQLRLRARELYAIYEKNSAINDALVAAGKTTTLVVPDCEYGNRVFMDIERRFF